MSTTTSARLNEYFVRLPACKADGTNWTYFRDRFLFAIDAAGLGDHLDGTSLGTSTEPVAPAIADTSAPTADEKKATADFLKERKVWRSEQAIIKQGIATCIPDALFLKVKGAATALLMWDKVKNEYQKKSRMVTVDLRRRLQDERCAEGGDVAEHLKKLLEMRADLIAMEADPGDENFVTIVLGSLPTAYDGYLSALTGAAQLMGKKLDVDFVIQSINDETDRQNTRNGKVGSREAAFNANGRRPECYNCGKPGHIAKNCWAKGGGKEGQYPKGKANTANANNDEFDGVW